MYRYFVCILLLASLISCGKTAEGTNLSGTPESPSLPADPVGDDPWADDPWETPRRVGDPGLRFDMERVDMFYAKYIDEWRTAGVEDGIPFLSEQLEKVDKTFGPGTAVAEIAGYLERNKGHIVLLKNGEYTFDSNVRIYDNSVLIGESRDGVVIRMCGEASAALNLYNAKNAGVRNLTLIGDWATEEPDPTDMSETLEGKGSWKSVNLSGMTSGCYVDNVRIVNSASHPIWMSGSHNTIRDVEIDGAYCKGGGAQGYFFIDGDHQLITGCKVTHIRHVTMQNPTSKWNVFYKNDMHQEFSFHVNDGGCNLIEYNKITIPPALQGYTAIMGPWSVQHEVGGTNFIYRNICKEENHPDDYGFSTTPWSDGKLYLGPHEVVGARQWERLYNNFRPDEKWPAPSGKTLYPVILD